MKYGNFIGCEFLPLENQEKINRIVLHLQKQLTDVFGKDYFKKPVIQIKNDSYVKSMIIYFPLKTPIREGRNPFGARIFDIDSIFFFITKEKGYLEITDPENPFSFPKERDYENAPEFSYSCNLNVIGEKIGYKCRSKRDITIRKGYTYGTEPEDLTYDVSELERLKETITKCK